MRSTGIQLRVSDLLFALQKRWLVILSLTFLGLIFGLLLSGLTYVQESVQLFNVRGSASITTRNSDNSFLGGYPKANANDVHLAEEMIDSVIYVMRSDYVIDSVINEYELVGVTIGEVRSSLSVVRESGTAILRITLSWKNADEGLQIWNGILNTTNNVLPRVLMTGHLELINEPKASAAAQSSSVSSTSMLLAVVGFIAGVGFAVMELLMRPTLTNVKDVETVFGLETLGIIPRDTEFFRKKTSILVKDEVGNSEVLQNFASAAHILRNRLNAREKHHCIYVTSSVGREGRSTVAANLAIQLSDMEHKTLLIDLDTHNPSLGMMFLKNYDHSNSLNALYRGEITEHDAITTLTGYLDLLPMVLEQGGISVDSVIVDLILRLKEQYEYVIIDTPPVGKNSDALSLNQVANAALFVIGYDSATIPEIQGSLEKLDKSGIRVIGCIVVSAQSATKLSLNMEDLRVRQRDERRENKKKEEAFADLEVEEADAERDALLKLSRGRRKPRKKALSKKKKEAEETKSAPAPKMKLNILEELSVPEKREEERTTEEITDELIRIGLENSRAAGEQRAEEAETENEQPAEAAAVEETLSREAPEEDSRGETAAEKSGEDESDRKQTEKQKKKNGLFRH